MAHRRAVSRREPAACPTRSGRASNGWLVEPGDPSALAGAISGALERRETLAAFGDAEPAIVEREFSWDAAGAATIRLYEEL